MSITDAYVGLDTLKFAPIGFTSDGDNTVVAATSGKKIRVVSYVLTAATTAGLVIFKDSGATYATLNVALTDTVSYAGSLEAPAFETSAGLGLTLSNGTGVDSYGHLTYLLV